MSPVARFALEAFVSVLLGAAILWVTRLPVPGLVMLFGSE